MSVEVLRQIKAPRPRQSKGTLAKGNSRFGQKRKNPEHQRDANGVIEEGREVQVVKGNYPAFSRGIVGRHCGLRRTREEARVLRYRIARETP